MTDLPYAEDVNYWKSGKSSAESWLDKTVGLIESINGKVSQRAHAQQDGRECFMLGFTIGEDSFKLMFPVLDSNRHFNKSSHREDTFKAAARRQAATLLYHDTKAKVMMARIFGARYALLPYLQTPNGTVGDVVMCGQLSDLTPKLLTGGV